MVEGDSSLTYRAAGVDIDAGNELVERIKPYAQRTRRPEMLSGLGGFGALMALPSGYHNPVLVSGTDGVGTKLKLALKPASTTPSALIWWRCASMTLSCVVPSRCFSWIIMPPASWMWIWPKP
ncbi:MAG: hypothetical protein R3E95_06625 [Thiolinea sp.]